MAVHTRMTVRITSAATAIQSRVVMAAKTSVVLVCRTILQRRSVVVVYTLMTVSTTSAAMASPSIPTVVK